MKITCQKHQGRRFRLRATRVHNAQHHNITKHSHLIPITSLKCQGRQCQLRATHRYSHRTSSTTPPSKFPSYYSECVIQQPWLRRFSDAIFPVGSFFSHKAIDSLWWLGKSSAHNAEVSGGGLWNRAAGCGSGFCCKA